jgi:hypothetical protein
MLKEPTMGQRIKAPGIPEKLLRWIEAFCSELPATIPPTSWTTEGLSPIYSSSSMQTCSLNRLNT